ncbi:MAG: hypothetical protein P4L80_02255 [Xanthobacteraceae bacterium]|nr:hypothetical protein [Xanthobacteraceae bacterium]
MQKTLLALTVAAGVGLVCSQSAGAVPASPTAVKEAAATSPVQQAQYAERRTRNGVVKCYRDFVVGPYRCHYFRAPF